GPRLVGALLPHVPRPVLRGERALRVRSSPTFANQLRARCSSLPILLSVLRRRLHCHEGLGDVGLVDDVVAVEDGTRLVAADPHGDRGVDTSPNEVPDTAPSKIVEKQPWHTSGRSRLMPALPDVPDATPSVMKQEPPISRLVTPLDKGEE